MPGTTTENPKNLPVTVIVGARSKWQADGPNTILHYGHELTDHQTPDDARWGLGGALALKFAGHGHHVVLTSRDPGSLGDLTAEIERRGGQCQSVALDLSSETSITEAFNTVRTTAGEPDVVVFNAGYMAGRELPADEVLMEYFPSDGFESAIDAAVRGPFLVAREVLADMRTRGSGAILFTNNSLSLRGKKRMPGQSLYYPRTMIRALSQALTEEYSEFGVHVANVVIDGVIDSPGTRMLPAYRDNPELIMNPVSIADAFYYLYAQDTSCWTHELQLTPAAAEPSY